LDAYAAAFLARDGRGKGVASSITGSFEKLNADANEAQKHYSDLSILIFYTTQKVPQPKKAKWAEKIRNAYGYELVVLSREEIIASLQLPDNASLCRSHLKIPVPYQPSITDLRIQAHDASSAVAAAWAAHPRILGKPRAMVRASVSPWARRVGSNEGVEMPLTKSGQRSPKAYGKKWNTWRRKCFGGIATTIPGIAIAVPTIMIN
jgi:hypothetical protein